MAVASSVDIRFTNLSYAIPNSSDLPFPLSKLSSKRAPPNEVLHELSGYIPPSSFVAILGPSGSGKTTFLNLLAGRSEHPPSKGQILFSGKPRVARTKRRIGYVMQDDIFLSKLTVYQTLSLTARLRLPHLLKDGREAAIQKVLNLLRLNKCKHTRIGDQQFDKGISGGERKRLSIANELLHDPLVLLADECTSGLDSSSAYIVIRALEKLSKSGRTVAVTVHQPSSTMFSIFDFIMVLGEGRVAYFGRPGNVAEYFEKLGFHGPSMQYNTADFLLELVSVDVIDEEEERIMGREDEENPRKKGHTKEDIFSVWKKNEKQRLMELENNFKGTSKSNIFQRSSGETSSSLFSSSSAINIPPGRSSIPNSVGADPAGPSTPFGRMRRAILKRLYDVTGNHSQLCVPDKYPSSWFHQVTVLCRRSIAQKRGLILSPVSILQLIITSIVVALSWWRMEPAENRIQDRLGVLSFLSGFWSFSSMLPVIFIFSSEKAVLNKDRAGGYYRLSAYYFAKNLVELPADTIYPIISASITYFAIGLNPDIRSFILSTIILTLTVLTAQSIGLLISAAIMDTRKAQIIATIWLLMSFLVAGYYVNPDNVPMFMRWLRTASFLRYAFEGMVKTEMLFGRSFECNSGSSVYASSCPIEMEALVRGAQLSDLSIFDNVCALTTFLFGARLLGYFALKILHTAHKARVQSDRKTEDT